MTDTPTITADQLDAILGQKDNGDAFNELLEKSRNQLGLANWRTRDSSSNDGLIVDAAVPAIANELAAVIDHADIQIKFWTAQKEAAREVVKDAITAAAAEKFPEGPNGEDTAPKVITFRANNVTIATYNRSADSRGIDLQQVKALFPDTPDNALLWKTTPGSRRLLLK